MLWCQARVHEMGTAHKLSLKNFHFSYCCTEIQRNTVVDQQPLCYLSLQRALVKELYVCFQEIRRRSKIISFGQWTGSVCNSLLHLPKFTFPSFRNRLLRSSDRSHPCLLGITNSARSGYFALAEYYELRVPPGGCITHRYYLVREDLRALMKRGNLLNRNRLAFKWIIRV